MSLTARVVNRAKSWLGFGSEGALRGPFAGMGELGGSYALGSLEDGWQRNLRAGGGRDGVAALQSAIVAYVSAFMLMPAHHQRQLDTGGFTDLPGTALAKWLARPNGWQTAADFWQCGMRTLYSTGNAVAAAARNGRGEIVAAVWASHFSVYRVPGSGELFYTMTLSDGTGSPEVMVPARDVLHLRINTDNSRPLDGRSPVAYCSASLATNATLSAFLVSYLNNRASPSYALATDAQLTREQMAQLRSAWDEQSQALASGKTPILANGLKPVMLGVAPGDELLVQTFNLTVEDIARAFAIPKALLGISETAANAEGLYRAWLSLGLGAVIELVEQGIERLFDLSANEQVNFDANALLRLDAEAQMRSVSQGVVSGVLSADEGRAKLGMPPVRGGFGRIPTQQQQQVPLDLLHELHTADIAARTAPKPQPVAAPVAEPKPESPPEKKFTRGVVTKNVKQRLYELRAATT